MNDIEKKQLRKKIRFINRNFWYMLDVNQLIKEYEQTRDK